MSSSLWSHGLYSPWKFPDQNTGVGILPTQGSNPGLLHCEQILYQLNHKGSPRILEWVAYPFSRESSQPRNGTGVSCIAGEFFTNWAQGSLICQKNGRQEKDNTVGFHLYMETESTALTDTDRMLLVRVWGVREIWRCGSRGIIQNFSYKFQGCHVQCVTIVYYIIKSCYKNRSLMLSP